MEKNKTIHRAYIGVKFLIHENEVMFNIYWVYILQVCDTCALHCGWAEVKKNLLQLPILLLNFNLY